MRVDFIFYDSVASINGEAAGDRIGPRSTAVAFQDFRFRNRHRIDDIVARAVNRQSTAYRSNDAPPFNGIGSRECYRGRAGSGPHRVDVGFGWPKITLAHICFCPQQQQLFIANDGQRIRRSCGDGDAQDALKVVECRGRVAYNHLVREALIAGFGLKRRMSHQLHELSLVILKNFIELVR